MDAERVEDKLREIAAQVLRDVPTVLGPESRLREDLGADSLDQILLLHEVENAFGIVVSDEVAQRLCTVGDVLELVLRNGRS